MTGSGLLFVLAAVAGIVGAGFWFRVATSVDTSGEVVKGPDKRALVFAATATGIAMALASVGVLLPVLLA